MRVHTKISMWRAAYQMLWCAATLCGATLGVAQARPGAGTRPTLVDVEIRSSLEAALWGKSPGEGRALAAQVARLWRGPSHRGDRVQLLYRATAPDGATLEAMRYIGRKRTLEAYRFCGDDGIARYYDGVGARIEPLMRNAPVPRYEQITERVQRGRGKRRHAGDDLKAAEGSDVLLPFAGRVLRTNWHRRRNGLCVEVLLDAGYTARFLHLAKVADGVMKGVRLPAGALLGQVGSTGRSTGPHLHYELLRRGRPVEPLSVHGRGRCQLTEQALGRFVLQREALRRQLTGMPVAASQAAPLG